MQLCIWSNCNPLLTLSASQVNSASHSRFIKASEWHVTLPSFMGCLWSLQHDNISWQLTLYYNSLHLGEVFHQWISQSCTSDRFFYIVHLYKNRFHVLISLFCLVVKAISFLISMSHWTASHQQDCVNLSVFSLEGVVRSKVNDIHMGQETA